MNAINDIQSTADSRIAELEQQIANIKASRDCQATIAAGEEERARKAEAERDELRTWTKKVTGTISNAIGGGSEMFNRHGEEYRIDPDFVDGFIRQRRNDYHDAMYRHVRIKNDLTTRAESAEAKLAEAVKVINEALAALDGEPEYHYSGMGCGLEDRNIHNRYDAMHHGWDCALERAYGEHVIPAREAIDAFLASMKGGE
ncbi:hypothetical protein G6L30_07955 [Agrobacterium rhizogenes]|nr:hypothetical protein [Rhizobium rhizogenes]